MKLIVSEINIDSKFCRDQRWDIVQQALVNLEEQASAKKYDTASITKEGLTHLLASGMFTRKKAMPKIFDWKKFHEYYSMKPMPEARVIRFVLYSDGTVETVGVL